MSNRPEISYLIQNVLPLLTGQLDFPRLDDEYSVKIDEIPIPIASGVRKPDVVFYHSGIPVLLLEAKREGGSESKALNQAMDYATRYPVANYSKNNIKPKLIIVSIGRTLKWYKRWVDVVSGEAIDQTQEIEPLSYTEVLAEYGLAQLGRKQVLKPYEFRTELISDLVAIYKDEELVTPDVVQKVSQQILAWLTWGNNYTNYEPYISLNGQHEKQAQVRGLFNNVDIIGSIGPEAARVFREFILRAFQGQFNQYLTHQSIISFMYELVGEVTPNTTLLDFECGSGGYIAAAVDTFGVKLENVRGIDVKELPYTIAKTYLAIFFKQNGRDAIESLPIENTNGLYGQGTNWDIVMGNPAGGSKYDDVVPRRNDINLVYQNLQNDLDSNGRTDSASEYNFSVQQSVQSAKIGGKICLILPEGFFANSSDAYLRKYVAKHCKVQAIVSLPRGVFRRGTSTRSQNSGSSTSSQKMSILLAEKTNEVVKGASLEIQPGQDYSVFMAQISEQSGNLDDWLEPLLNAVAEQWRSWRSKGELTEIAVIDLPKLAKVSKPVNTALDLNEQLQPEPVVQAPTPQIQTSVDANLLGVFGVEGIKNSEENNKPEKHVD